MKLTREQEMIRLMRSIRAAFNDMRAAADVLHGEVGINASQRAVLEFLSENGPSTVPQIARDKNVSRQHIQKISDALVADGFAHYEENPDHKRSQLIAMSATGYQLFDGVLVREGRHLQALALSYSSRELTEASEVLAKLSRELRLTGHRA